MKKSWINIAIIIFEIIGFAQGIHASMFIYFTNLSNLVALAVCVTELFISNRHVRSARYMATCMTTLTMLVVIFILVPMQGVQMLYRGNFLCFHLICPLLMLVSFIMSDDRYEKISVKTIGLGMAPALVYAAVTIVLNCVGVLVGPYPFLVVKNQPVFVSVIWGVVVLGIAGAIAAGLIKLHQRLAH